MKAIEAYTVSIQNETANMRTVRREIENQAKCGYFECCLSVGLSKNMITKLRRDGFSIDWFVSIVDDCKRWKLSWDTVSLEE